LAWPPGLNLPAGADGRKAFGKLLARSVRQVQGGKPLDADGRKALDDAVQALQTHLRAVVGDLKPAEYVEGKHYVTRLTRAVEALGKPGIFQPRKPPTGCDNVTDLVAHLVLSDLRFRPAKKGGEGAYLALHMALRIYRDAVVPPAGR